MSTIRVDNFGPSAGGTTYSARGIAKAWVNFNGIGTIAVRDSENVSSLTDGGAGDYTVNFSSSFANVNFACLTSKGNVGTNVATSVTDLIASRAVSSVRIACVENSAFADSANVNSSIHGDLA